MGGDGTGGIVGVDVGVGGDSVGGDGGGGGGVGVGGVGSGGHRGGCAHAAHGSSASYECACLTGTCTEGRQ